MFIGVVLNLTLVKVSAAFVAIISTGVMARLFTPAEYGGFVAAQAALAVGVRVSSFGLGQTAQYAGSVEEAGSRELFSRILAALIILVLLLFVLTALFPAPFINLLGDGTSQSARFLRELLIWTPISLFSFVVSLYFLGRADLYANFLFSFVPPVVFCAFTVAAFGMGLSSDVVLVAAKTQILSSGCLALYIMARRRVLSTLPQLSGISSLLLYSGSSFFVFLCTSFLARGSVLIGSVYASEVDLAYFSAAVTYCEILNVCLGASGPALFSRLGNVQSLGVQRETLARVGAGVFVVSLLLACGAGIAAPFFVPILFGENFQNAASLVVILLPGVVLSSHQRLLENFLYSVRRQRLLISIHVVSLATMFSLGGTLAASFGSYGLCLLSTLISLVIWIGTAIFAGKHAGLTFGRLLLPNMADLSALMSTARKLLSQSLARS
jgi:O-antigen/teichoic acid export membrane protein